MMKKTNKVDDDNFVWVGDPDTGRWVTTEEYNKALRIVSNGTYPSLERYFQFLANYDKDKNNFNYYP